MNSESPTKPPAFDSTPGAIEKYILSETLQNPLTTFSAAVAILSGLYMLAFGANNASLLLALGAGVLSVGTFIFNYFIRGERLAQDYVRKQLEQRRANRENEIVIIHDEFRRLNDKEGEQAALELHQAYQKFKSFLQAREARGTAMMKSMRLQILAEDTYFQGVEVLRTAAGITRALQEINVEKLQREVQDWQKLRDAESVDHRELSALERRIELNQQRINSYRQRQSALAELFAEAEACEASLEEAYMQFAGAESAVALPKSNVDNAITRLETAVAAARRVETRIKNMSAADEIYLAASEKAN
ncbi:hypothetical protein L0337_15145 [candidate division KSB1 bacterium]|nr:hypothetical protein [candidate division KSB1 bacterium]